MVLGSICVIVVLGAFFGFRSAAQKEMIAYMAAAQAEAMRQQRQS